MNRDAVASQQAPLFYASTSVHPCCDESDTLTLLVSGNSVASAQTVIDLYYAMGY